MAQSWIEIAGKFTLYFFFVCIGSSFVVIAIRALSGRLRDQHSVAAAGNGETPFRSDGDVAKPGLDRFFVEYVGNTSADDPQPHGQSFAVVERRKNQETRALMERIEREMNKHGVPRREREAALEGLRRSVRLEENLQEIQRRGLEEINRDMQEERSGLAARIGALLVDVSPELVAQIAEGLVMNAGAVDEADERK